MIPEEKKNAVKQALQTAFGVTEFEDIRALNTGLSSALIYRIVVKGKPYLLRVITNTDAVSDPSRWFDLMRTAAEAGLAPHVWYTNADERVAITDFIEAKAFELSEARIKMPDLLKRLHSLPPFPFRLNYLDAMNGFVQKFREAKVLPEDMTGEIFRQYERIKSVYPRNDSDMVACHNDLKPENILFDGAQVWLVDWEAAFLNDRYMDLSVVANFVVTNDREEKDYLGRYFGEEVDEYRLARFFLMRQLLHIFYFTVFMRICFTAGEKIDLDSVKPNFREFNDRMWAGEIDLAGIDNKQLYAWVHLEQVRHNMRLKRFEDSLKVISGKNHA